MVTDPEEWRIVYVLDSNGDVWMTPNVLTTGFSKLTFNLKNFTTDPRSIDIVRAADGHKVLLVGGGKAAFGADGLPLPGAATGGVYQLIDPDPTHVQPMTPSPADTLSWVKLGLNLPNVPVTSMDWTFQDDVLDIATFGRSAYSIHNIASKIGQPGVLTINGDTDGPNENDNIILRIDPNNSLLLDVYLNSGTPVEVIPTAALAQIKVNGLGGADTLTVDFRGGVFTVPAGLVFDGGGNEGDTLVVYAQNGTKSIVADNPSGDGLAEGNGALIVDGAVINYLHLSPIIVNDAAELTFTTPSSTNVLTLDSQAAGQIRISGSSGGASFESVTAVSVEHVTINLALHDGHGSDDRISTTAADLEAVANTGFSLEISPNVDSTLFLDAQGMDVVLDQHHITVGTAEPILFDNLSRIELANSGNVTVLGASSHDALVVTATGTADGDLQLNNGPDVFFDGLVSLTFNGAGGSDALTINNPVGTIFAPSGGIAFDSGGGAAILTLTGGGSSDFSETFNAGPGIRSGNIVFDGPQTGTITLTHVAYVTDTVIVGTFTVNGTDDANMITLDDGVVLGDGLARITIDAFPLVDFANKTDLFVNAGLTDADQADIIDVNYHEIPTGLTAVTFNGDAGNDAVYVFSSPAGVPTAVNAGAGDDLIAVRSDLTVPLNLYGGDGNDTIYGGAGNSLIDGGSGNNTLRAQGGNATIDSDGTDLIYTGDGQVTVSGGAGSETVYGGAGNDTINGDQGQTSSTRATAIQPSWAARRATPSTPAPATILFKAGLATTRFLEGRAPTSSAVGRATIRCTPAAARLPSMAAPATT